MKLLYFKQAFYLLKENKLISFISIIGTAFAIAMIMVIMILFNIRNADYSPEVNRGRTLSIQFAEAYDKQSGDIRSMNFFPSLYFFKESVLPLKTPEKVTLMTDDRKPLSLISGKEKIAGRVKYTDTGWTYFFDIDFLKGKMFSEADFSSGMKQVVVREETARKLFHTIDVVGQTILIGGVPFTVCGVFKDFSIQAAFAYTDVVVPYTCVNKWKGGMENVSGSFRCLILASSPDDFDAIRKEVDLSVERFNQHQSKITIGLRGQPYTHFEQLFFVWDQEKPHVQENVIRYSVTLFILLLVPAINLSGLTLSRMRRRMEEIGIRKAFGATRWQLMNQVLTENLLISLLGGILGLLLSYLSLFLFRDWLLNNDPLLSAEMLVSPQIFILAFLFCLVMNLLSAAIPAWSVANKNITNTLK